MSENAIERAATLLSKAQHAVALTGAGISTPSGIPDFRSRDSGLWTRYDPRVVASISGFKANPEAFYSWIRPLAQALFSAKPNPAHLALARLEAIGKLKSVITQNIDMLHTRAGSNTVYEVHGHCRELTCISCFRIFPSESYMDSFLADEDMVVLNCPECGNILKPNVILFGEQLPASVYEAASRDSRRCDVMLVVGSSLEVYPVADLPRKALEAGAELIIVNHDKTNYGTQASVLINGNVEEILPVIVAQVEAKIQ